MVEHTIIEILIVSLFFENSHEARGKNVWEFGNDVSESVIIDVKEGVIDAFSKGLDYNIIAPRCHRVVYVKVEVDNPASTPDVTLNFENVAIKYAQDQTSESTYKISVKGVKVCNIYRIGKCNGVGNLCGYYDDATKSWSFDTSKFKPLPNRESSNSSKKYESSEISQSPVKHVWRFGENLPKSIKLMREVGFIRDKVYKLTIQIAQPKYCFEVVYVKVIVINEESKPKVTSDLKIVKIKYKESQQTASQYEILAKGINTCKGKFLF